MAFTSMQDVKRANREIGHHFFDREAMDTFRSRIETGLLDGHWFVTSEVYGPDYESPRTYMVRYAKDDGSIATLTIPFDSWEKAVEVRDRLAANNVDRFDPKHGEGV